MRFQQITVVWAFSICLLIVGCRQSVDVEPNHDDLDLGQVEDFTLSECQGNTLSRADLLGKYWIASFIFTHCTGECPQVSGTMARLQHELNDQPDVRLVSISVDPDRDTPEALRAYAQGFDANPKRWHFLTGSKDQVYKLIVDSFHLPVHESAAGPDRQTGREVSHSSRLMLVDKHGHIRGMFEGEVVDQAGQPVDDAPRLLQRIQQLRRDMP
jgi:protein SCO1/2